MTHYQCDGCGQVHSGDCATPAPEFGSRRVTLSPPKSSVNDIQVGGSHYRSEYQHWDLVIKLNIHYLIGCASKYVTRRKDPKKRGEDLNKAVHYIEKAIEADVQATFMPLSQDLARQETAAFALANQLTFRESEALYHMIRGEYEDAKRHIQALFVEQA